MTRQTLLEPRDQPAPDKQAVDYEVQSYLIQLYGTDQGQRLHQHLRDLASRTAAQLRPPRQLRSEAEAILICYGDTLRDGSRVPLQVLDEFATKKLKGIVSGIHILPFFPSSSDDGFAIVDYQRVRPDLGDWSDIQDLSNDFELMVDLVINHCSREHLWFIDFITHEAPGKDFFHELDGHQDLNQVLRPRNSPLLTDVHTRSGVKKVWTTFSDDQVDLNFANPDVLVEFVQTLFFYARMGARYIRLDAIAYLWKRLGTSCMSLPETHMVVRILRGLIDVEDLPIILITETNVPHEENISYFGEGNEAHLVYQFSLAPLLLYSYLLGNAQALVDWTRNLKPPPEGCSYFNFMASHDGIGMRPLEGLLPEAEIEQLIDVVHKRGGFASMRTMATGVDRAYELNIALFSAFGDQAHSIDAYIGAHQLLLAYQGVPGLYLNALLGTANDYQQMETTGRTRSINRGSWELSDLDRVLADEDSHHGRVFFRLMDSLAVRKEQPAFASSADQTFVSGSAECLIFLRHDEHQRVLVVASFAEAQQPLAWPSQLPLPSQAKDLLSGDVLACDAPLVMGAFQVRWLDLA